MFGHGNSSGDFTNASVSRWTEDALQIITKVCEGPQIIVGSSMGGWIMVNIAQKLEKTIAGLIGVAVAPDFTEDLLWNHFTDKQKSDVLRNGEIAMPSNYQEEPYNIGLQLIEDGRRNLVLKKGVSFNGPVILLHGTLDQEVPWQTSVRLAEKITSSDVKVVLVKNGEHNLSRPSDISLIINSIETVCSLAG
jgi:pimeloyl-ACP methyl ester carboxylesterase